MAFATLFPLGILQLYESVDRGYLEARSLQWLTHHTNSLIEWLRLPGDVVFILVGVLPAALPVLARRPPHGEAGRDRGARGDPVHRAHRRHRARQRRGNERGCDRVSLAAGYGLFLALSALGLDALARHSHRRAARYRTAGFTYLDPSTPGSAPRGSAAPGGDRPSAAARPLPARGAHLQRLPAQGRRAPTRTRAARSPARSILASFGGRSLPPGRLCRPGRACGADRQRSPWFW